VPALVCTEGPSYSEYDIAAAVKRATTGMVHHKRLKAIGRSDKLSNEAAESVSRVMKVLAPQLGVHGDVEGNRKRKLSDTESHEKSDLTWG